MSIKPGELIKLSNVQKPYVIFETDDFLVFYKPPFWKMDTSRKYDINNIYELKKVFRYNPPLHVYIGLWLKVNHGITPDNDSYNAVQRYDVQRSDNKKPRTESCIGIRSNR